MATRATFETAARPTSGLPPRRDHLISPLLPLGGLSQSSPDGQMSPSSLEASNLGDLVRCLSSGSLGPPLDGRSPLGHRTPASPFLQSPPPDSPRSPLSPPDPPEYMYQLWRKDGPPDSSPEAGTVFRNNALHADGCQYNGYAGPGQVVYQNDKHYILYSDGGIYEGEWLGGRRHGKGTMVFPNRTTFTGLYAENLPVRRQADAELTFPLEDGGLGVYRGELFVDVDPDKRGYTQQDGTYVVEGAGDNLAIYREGFGTLWETTRGGTHTQYAGQWHDDTRHGEGKFFCARGGAFAGYFSDQNASGIYRYADGSRYEGDVIVCEGDYAKGTLPMVLRHGQGSFHDANGNLVHRGGWDRDQCIPLPPPMPPPPLPQQRVNASQLNAMSRPFVPAIQENLHAAMLTVGMAHQQRMCPTPTAGPMHKNFAPSPSYHFL